MGLAEQIADLERSRNNIRFNELVKISREHFGNERTSSSHHIFKTPWPGDPRINLQKDGNKAKPYQVDQVAAALKKLLEMDERKPEGEKGKK